MKKIISLILALIMIFSLVSCSRDQLIVASETAESNADQSEPSEEAKTEEENTVHNSDGVFAVGFGRADINPKPGVAMSGFGNFSERKSKTIIDSVMSTCIAIKDASGNIALAIAIDMCGTGSTEANYLRDYFQKTYNIPTENIYISASHTHSGPTTGYDDPATLNYRATFYKGVKDSVDQAIKDLDKAEAYFGVAETEGLNFVRRIVDANGKFLGMNCEGYDTETQVDNHVQVIKFARENQKDIVMVNFPCHATWVGTSVSGDVSADFIAPLRKKLEKDDGVLCQFMQGAAGNVVPSTRIEKFQATKATSVKEHGERLAGYVSQIIKGDMTKLETGTIKAIDREITLTVDHSRDSEAANAKIVYDILQTDLNQAHGAAGTYGFTDAYDARDVYTKSTMPATSPIHIGAVVCGDIALCWFPYEMFDTNGMQVKNGSSFKGTMICELANAGHSYIPSTIAFKHGGYEVRSCKYVDGTGEQIANEMLKILNELK